MFLDLSYVIRRIMRQHGHENPEIIGIFLTPRSTGIRPNAGMGNTLQP